MPGQFSKCCFYYILLSASKSIASFAHEIKFIFLKLTLKILNSLTWICPIWILQKLPHTPLRIPCSLFLSLLLMTPLGNAVPTLCPNSNPTYLLNPNIFPTRPCFFHNFSAFFVFLLPQNNSLTIALWQFLVLVSTLSIERDTNPP